jgi:hypothetical protein
MNGDARYFMMVHDAFNKLQDRHNEAKKYRNVPTEKSTYDPDILLKADNITPQKMKKFTTSKFNSHFNKNKITDSNPYIQGGYANFMVSSNKNREDIDIAKSQNVQIPTHKLVVYKEPECLPSSSKIFGDCYEFGNTNVNDYSGGGGTDIMQAYAHKPELLDTQTRYKSIDEISSRRAGESLTMNKEEKMYHDQQQKNKERLEQYRLNNMNNDSQRIANQYVQLHRRLL